MTVVDLHRQEGTYCTLADLPQRKSIADSCMRVSWPDLDDLFRMYLGQLVIVTGVAGHGKSTLMLNVLLDFAKHRRTKAFLYVPENEAHLKEKLWRIWGPAPGFEEFAKTLCYVQSAVPQTHDEPPHTIEWVLDQAAFAVVQDGVEIVMIDPWNELERSKPRDMLLSDYIGQCLMLTKQFCRVMNVAVIIIAHPTKAVNEGGGRTATMADIEGSMNWFNKADNGLIVVREVDHPNTSRVISAKVREIGAGRPGSCYFFVDPETGIFTPQHGSASL